MSTVDMQPTSRINEEEARNPANGQPEEESFKSLFEASLREQPVLLRGQIIKGVVVSAGMDSVTVDIGAKAEGSLPASEFAAMGVAVPAVGDDVEVLVKAFGEGGASSISALEAHRHKLWAGVEQALQDGSLISATIDSEVKGGYRVTLGGLAAFMPRSEADINPHTVAEELLGQGCEVAILKAERKQENIVVSRKQPLARKVEERRQAFFAQAVIGDKVCGKVKRLTDFGAFVDIGGVDALLHVSDIAWRRLAHPGEMLAAGQQITAEITKLNPEAGKVSISMRALQADPWEHVREKYEPGMRLTGTVRRLLDYGAMVELEPGVEGMIHCSEMSWTQKEVNPSSVLAEGDVVDVAVLNVDTERRRIALSLKEVMENPWQAWLSAHPVGSRVKGLVRNKTDFGMFVGLGTKLDGLVHIGEMSWDRPGEEAIGEYRKGQEIECVVRGVDVERQRISLSIKRLAEDPLSLFLDGAGRGMKVSGKVVEVKPSAVIVSLAEGVDAVLPLRETLRDEAAPKVGDSIEAKVIETDKRRRKVVLSIRQLQRDEERDAIHQYRQDVASQGSPSALALELQRTLLVQAGKNDAAGKRSGKKAASNKAAKPGAKKHSRINRVKST